MKPPLNLSRGQRLDFAADDKPVSGVVVGSENTRGPWASVAVETDGTVPDGAHLTVHGIPEACGRAKPEPRNGRVMVILSIPYSCIDLSTIGK